MNDISELFNFVGKNMGVVVETALLEPETWHIFTYRAATGSNNYSVQAIDFM